jgi:hypothetical protein
MFLDNFDVNYDNMYNAELKSEFIEASFSHLSKLDIETLIRLFNVVGQTEHQNKKDLYEFNFRELVDLFERNEWQRMNTFTQRKSILKSYIDYCVSLNKVDVDIHPIYRIKHTDVMGLKRLDRQYVKNFEELRKLLDYVYDNADVEDTIQFIFPKLVFCLSWLGFTKDEVRNLKKDDVKPIAKTITASSGYSITNIDDYIIDLAIECINLEQYTTTNRYGKRKVSIRQNSYLIRTKGNQYSGEEQPVPDTFVNNTNSRFRTLTEDFSPTDEYYNKAITCDSIFWSGAYSRLFEYDSNRTIDSKNYELLSKVSRIDESQILGLSNFFVDYTKWRKFFYGY